jgi:hypothetical protein
MKAWTLTIMAVAGLGAWAANNLFINGLQQWQPQETRLCPITKWIGDREVNVVVDCAGKAVTYYSPTLLADLLNQKLNALSCTRSVSSITQDDRENCKLPD